jgi:acyl transferase domain-containing protein
MMEPVLHLFMTKVKKMELNSPQLPYVSNLTGQWITAPEATNPNYWAAHMRQTVRFADGLAELARGQKGIFLEVGPGQMLATLARQHPAASACDEVIATLGRAKGESLDQASMLNALGRLWLAGLAVPGPGFHAQQRRHRVPLPTYPFERKRYWVEPADLGERDNPLPLKVGSGRIAPPITVQKKSEAHEDAEFDSTPSGRRKDDTLSELNAVFQDLSGTNLAEASDSATLLEFGGGSLVRPSRTARPIAGGELVCVPE